MPETLRDRDRRFIVVCLIVAAACLVFALRYFHRAFPEASIDFEVTRESSRAVAERFLESQGIAIAGTRHASRFQFDDEAKVFLERELGLGRLDAEGAREVRLWRWAHRWFRPMAAEEVRVEVTPRGEIAGFQHVLAEDAPGADLPPDAARALAESFLVLELGRRIDTLDFADAETQKRARRTDHVFTWRIVGRDYRGAVSRISVTVAGDRIAGCAEWLDLPEDWTRGYARLRAHNDSAVLVDSLLVALLAVGLAVTLGRRIRRRDVRWRTAFAFGAVALVLQGLAGLNGFPLAEYAFDTSGSQASFLLRTLGGALLSALGSGLLVFLLTAAAEPVYREAFPEHLSIGRMLSWHGLRTRAFLVGSLGGVTLAVFFVAYAIAFYLVAQRLGAWAPAEVPYTDLLSTRVPWVSVLLGGFVPAVAEEWLFRAFAIPFLGGLLRSRWGAGVAAAFIWGFGHASYPNQPFFIRGVEVGIAGLVFGWALTRFGIVAPLVAHYSIDAFYSALLFLRSDDPWLAAVGALTAGVPLVPLAAAAAAYLATGTFQAEAPVSNAAHPAPRARPEHPAPVPPALPDYAPLGRPAAAGAVVLVAAGAAALVLRPEQFGGSLHLGTGPRAAERIAADFLRAEGFDPSPFRRVTQPVERMDPTAAQYVYTAGGIPGLARIFGTGRLVPAVTWQTRFFRPLESEEYDVETDPATGRPVAFRHQVPEASPGGDLDRSRALARALGFLRRRGPDPAQLEMVDARSEKPRTRRDTTFTWEARDGAPGAVAGARVRVEAGVVGDRIGLWARSVRVPEAWLRVREGTTAYSLAVLGARALFVAVLALLGFGVLYRATRLGRVQWRLALKVALAALALEIVEVVNGGPQMLFRYDTRIDPTVFGLTALAQGASTVLAITIAAGLAAALILARHPAAAQMARPACLRLWRRDAALGAMATLGALSLVRVLDAVLHRVASRWALAPALQLPANLGTLLPLASSVRDAALGALFAGALLAFAVHLWVRRARHGWQRTLLAAGLAVSLLPPGARRLSEALVEVVPALLFVAALGWLVATYLRDNPLAYGISAAVLALARAAGSLAGLDDPWLEVQAWLLVGLSIGLVAGCLGLEVHRRA